MSVAYDLLIGVLGPAAIGFPQAIYGESGAPQRRTEANESPEQICSMSGGARCACRGVCGSAPIRPSVAFASLVDRSARWTCGVPTILRNAASRCALPCLARRLAGCRRPIDMARVERLATGGPCSSSPDAMDLQESGVFGRHCLQPETYSRRVIR